MVGGATSYGGTMIERSFDAEFLNSVLNHPEVYPWVCGEMSGPFDFTEIVKNPEHYVLRSEHGAFLVIHTGEGIYDVHTQFLPEGRGTALAAGKEAIEYMRAHSDFKELTTMVPDGNSPAKRLAENAGFKSVGVYGTWLLHGNYVPLEHFRLTRDQ